MHGVGHGHHNVAGLLRASLVHRPRIFYVLRFQPEAAFEDTDDLRRELPGQRHRIVDVVEVVVRDTDRIDSLDLEALRVFRVAVGPGVHYDDLPRREAEVERPMAQPGDLHAKIMARPKRGLSRATTPHPTPQTSRRTGHPASSPEGSVLP